MQHEEEAIELKSEEQTTTNSKRSNKNRLKDKDLNIVIFLILLYVIQGVPMGIASSIPLILSSRKVSYWDQGIYSFAQWPFSIRLLWAPLVDRFYINKIGRRKSWIIMCQLLSGLIMLSLGSFLNKLFNSQSENNKNNIYLLTLIFGSLVFLSATNDIVLDAWSLDLLNEYFNLDLNTVEPL